MVRELVGPAPSVLGKRLAVVSHDQMLCHGQLIAFRLCGGRSSCGSVTQSLIAQARQTFALRLLKCRHSGHGFRNAILASRSSIVSSLLSLKTTYAPSRESPAARRVL
jgi:hypothetical protein